jgi:hypothetical protein
LPELLRGRQLLGVGIGLGVGVGLGNDHADAR